MTQPNQFPDSYPEQPIDHNEQSAQFGLESDIAAAGLSRVLFPSELRSDNLALTYTDPDGDLYLRPTVTHNFSFSRLLVQKKLSQAALKRVLGEEYVVFPEAIDLVSLPAIFNVASTTEDGVDEMETALKITVDTLASIMKKTGSMPDIKTIRAVAIDRSSARAEFLPPYDVSAQASVQTFLDFSKADALSVAATDEERQRVIAAYNRVEEGLKS